MVPPPARAVAMAVSFTAAMQGPQSALKCRTHMDQGRYPKVFCLKLVVKPPDLRARPEWLARNTPGKKHRFLTKTGGFRCCGKVAEPSA